MKRKRQAPHQRSGVRGQREQSQVVWLEVRGWPHLVPLTGNDGTGFGVVQQDSAVQERGVLRREGAEVGPARPPSPDPSRAPSDTHLNPHQLGQLPLGRLEDAAGLAALVGPEEAAATGGRLVLAVTVFTGACRLLPGLLGGGLRGRGRSPGGDCAGRGWGMGRASPERGLPGVPRKPPPAGTWRSGRAHTPCRSLTGGRPASLWRTGQHTQDEGHRGCGPNPTACRWQTRATDARAPPANPRPEDSHTDRRKECHR